MNVNENPLPVCFSTMTLNLREWGVMWKELEGMGEGIKNDVNLVLMYEFSKTKVV